MIRTLPITQIEKVAETVYEACIIIAKRARQINAEQRQKLMREREFDEDYEGYGEDEGEQIIATDIDFLNLPKPTSLALEEFMAGKIEYSYREEEEDGNSQEKPE